MLAPRSYQLRLPLVLTSWSPPQRVMASLVRKVTGQVTGQVSGQAPERSDSRGDPDRLRTGLIRYAGYANEVGEAFRPLVPRAAVNASYVAASGYVVADAAWRANTLPTSSPRSPTVEVVDTLIWQGLASVIIPGEPFSARRNRESKAAPLATAAALAVSLAPQKSMRVLDCTLPAAPVLDRHGDQSHRVGSLAPDCCGLSRANGGGPRLHPADRAPNRPRRGLGADELPQTPVPRLAAGLGEARVVRPAFFVGLRRRNRLL